MQIDLKHSLVFLRMDGIIQVNCYDHNFSLSDVKEITNAHEKIANGKKKLLLIVADKYSNIDSDAREFMAKEERTQHSVAEAFVIKSLGQKILANFYLRVNKPNIPSKFFNDKESAISWLKGLK